MTDAEQRDECAESTEHELVIGAWNFLPDEVVDADIKELRVTDTEFAGEIDNADLKIEYEVVYDE